MHEIYFDKIDLSMLNECCGKFSTLPTVLNKLNKKKKKNRMSEQRVDIFYFI